MVKNWNQLETFLMNCDQLTWCCASQAGLLGSFDKRTKPTYTHPTGSPVRMGTWLRLCPKDGETWMGRGRVRIRNLSNMRSCLYATPCPLGYYFA